MRKTVEFFCTLSVVLLFAGCGPRVSFINTANLPDTYECDYMKTVCKEAAEFEHHYSELSKEEQDESKVILHTYRGQCESATEACKKSAKRD